MLKYVAILRVDEPAKWGNLNGKSTVRYYKSPICTKESEANAWLDKELKKYPSARINESKADKKYIIYTTLISFDTKKTQNIEQFLSKWISS